MALLAGYMLGSYLGGLILIYLLSWLASKLSPASLESRLSFGWLAACGIGVWSFMRDGDAPLLIAAACIAYTLAALTLWLALRRAPKKEEISDTFE